MVPNPLDEPWSIRALAEQADISGTTLVNWTKRDPHPLSVGTDESGARFITWNDLLEFCSKHPTQRGVKKVYAAARERRGGAAPTSGTEKPEVLRGARPIRRHYARRSPS